MGRRLVIGVGALAAAVIASFGFYFLVHWRDVATEYHARRLVRDPGHLERIVAEPDGSPARAAILGYIERPEGAQHLLRLYVSLMYYASESAKSRLQSGLPDTADRILQCESSGGAMTISWGPFVTRGIGVEDARLPILHRLVSEHDIASYEGFALESVEDVVFQVVRGPWVSILTEARSSSLYQNAEGYVCVARSKTARRKQFDPQAVPQLLQALASPNADESQLSRELLAEIGCDPDDPVTYLIGSIRRDPGGRFSFVQPLAVEGLSVVDDTHVPRLLAALEDRDPVIRHTVLQALIRRSSAPEKLIPYYLTAVRDDDVTIRDAAVEGLEKLGPVAIPALVKILDGGPGRLQYRALNAIGRFGEAAKPMIPSILAWIEGNSDPYMRKKVAEIVFELEPGNKEALAIAREVEEQLTRNAKTLPTEDQEN